MAKKNRPAVQSNSESKSGNVQQTEGEESPRRDFIKTTLAAGVGACALAAPLGAGALVVLSPASQSGRAGKFYPLATLDLLSEKPQKFSVIDDKQDAWMTMSAQKVGSVFLSKVGDEVRAFHALCPHMGCVIQVGKKINPKTGVEEEMFYCPCHAAYFAFNGERYDEVSPRDLDSLEVKVEDGQVFVKFENFVFGIAEKRS